MAEVVILFVLLLFSIHIHRTSTAEIDLISDVQFLTEEDTLVSPAGTFELGFFSPGSSANRYLGIWYKKISVRTVVWVANRDLPLAVASSAVLRIVHPGNLVVMNGTADGLIMWSSNTSSSSGNAIAKLDDMGNLVVMTDKNSILWQSFDYPTDTLLPGMKLGRDYLTGREWRLSSWKSSEDPAAGEFTFSIDTVGYPQIVLKQGSDVRFRSGPWNNSFFSGVSPSHMIINETVVAFTYYNLVNDTSVISRLTLNYSGELQRSKWLEDVKGWSFLATFPTGWICGSYNLCGAYGSCSAENSKTCSCLNETKFVPRNPKGWEAADWSGGCVRRTPLDCKSGSDRFITYSNVRLPDTHTSWFNMSMTLQECEAVCLKNCSCMAYSNSSITGEGISGCLLWFNDLLDIRLRSAGRQGGQDIRIRMSSSELDADADAQPVFGKRGTYNKFILIIVFMGALLIGLSSTLLWCVLRKRHHSEPMGEGKQHWWQMKKKRKNIEVISLGN